MNVSLLNIHQARNPGELKEVVQQWQIHAAFKDLLGEQIRHKLIAFEGQAKPSKINSVMKWWSKCISMVIAKTASRIVAFKAAKLSDSIFERQSETLMTDA